MFEDCDMLNRCVGNCTKCPCTQDPNDLGDSEKEYNPNWLGEEDDNDDNEDS